MPSESIPSAKSTKRGVYCINYSVKSHSISWFQCTWGLEHRQCDQLKITREKVLVPKERFGTKRMRFSYERFYDILPMNWREIWRGCRQLYSPFFNSMLMIGSMYCDKV